MAPRQEAKDIQAKVIRVYREDVLKTGGRIQLRTVSWIIDGKATAPRLELRELYKSESGQDRMGKAKGFSLADMVLLQDRWDELMADLQGRAAPAQTQTREAPGPAQSKPDPF